MEPHSRSWSSHNGTLRFPQALVLLLKTALAGPTSDRGTQTVSDLAPWEIIKKSAHRLISSINSFVVSDGWLNLTFVGMVKLVALCGIGSALWVWSKRSKGKAVSSSADPEHAEAVGKQTRRCVPYLLHHVVLLGPVEMA
jgi:hypothetical protein